MGGAMDVQGGAASKVGWSPRRRLSERVAQGGWRCRCSGVSPGAVGQTEGVAGAGQAGYGGVACQHRPSRTKRPNRINLPDKDARLMKTRQGIVPAFNAQPVVSPLAGGG